MSIFSNAEEILPVNKQLLVELEKKWENWSPTQTIGDTIYQMTPFLKVTFLIMCFRTYFYIHFYRRTRIIPLGTLRHWLLSESARKMLNSRVLHTNVLWFADLTWMLCWFNQVRFLCFSKGFRSNLIFHPVQRIPRYNLLLADLLKNTDESHPDYRNLEKSIEEMKNIAQCIKSKRGWGDRACVTLI